MNPHPEEKAVDPALAEAYRELEVARFHLDQRGREVREAHGRYDSKLEEVGRIKIKIKRLERR